MILDNCGGYDKAVASANMIVLRLYLFRLFMGMDLNWRILKPSLSALAVRVFDPPMASVPFTGLVVAFSCAGRLPINDLF